MDKRFLIAWAVVFAAWMAGDFLVHGVLLHADYAYLPSLFRPEAEGHKFIHLMVLAHVIMAGAFVWMYGRGVETKSWPAQGARYGLAVVLLTTVPTYTIYYVVQPMPGGLVVKQVLFEGILVVALGLLVAFLHRQPDAAASG